MMKSSKKWLSVLLVLWLSRDCQGWKPPIMTISSTMSPAKPEIYIDEGDLLELACTSAKAMKFYYPKTKEFTIETSPASLTEELLSDEQKIVFRRFETVRGDTGWYGCADYDFDVALGFYDQPEVSWMYVYVRSNTRYFVRDKLFTVIEEVKGENVILPCRPTSPHYKVILNTKDEVYSGYRMYGGPSSEQMGGKASYDPRFGFTLRNITFRDSTVYQCLIQEGHNSEEIYFQLDVIQDRLLDEPKIIEGSLIKAARDQTFHINCTILVNAKFQYALNWTTPIKQESDRITTRLYKEMIWGYLHNTTCELTINGVTDEDGGDYECTITTLSVTRKTKTFLMVVDPDTKYMNLTSLDNDTFYVKKAGDHIQWAVQIDAFPQPKLKWSDPNGFEINSHDKYYVNTTWSWTILTINRLTVKNMGCYALHAINTDEIKTLYFNLTVEGPPSPKLERPRYLYLPNQKVEMSCTILASSAPNVSWTLFKTPNYPSLNGSEMVKLTNYSTVPKMSTFLSVVTFTMEVASTLNCTACNSFGCASEAHSTFVSDVPDGFGIIETDNQLTEGDDAEITCAAAINFYIKVEWLNDMNEVIVESDRIWMTDTSTNSTRRSTLRIKNVRDSDNGSYYICRAMWRDHLVYYGDIERSQYKLLIHDAVAPFISDTNMNKSAITLDLRTDGHKGMVLTCHVRGIPRPNITWYKDDRRISANEQYEYRYDNQELDIKYFLEENTGTYACKAENRLGKDYNYQIISIKVKKVAKVFIISIAVLVLTCVIIIIYVSIKLQREKVMHKRLLEVGLTHFEEGAVQCLNPNLTVDDQAELLPYDKKWEFPRERLKLGRELGFGAFGVVTKADALGICKDKAVSTVAVKMVRKSTDSIYIRALASELKIMVHLGKHLNVVNLLGACTKNIAKRELLVIVEYCRFGNLHDYLLRYRADFINQIDPATRKLDPLIGLDALTRTMSVESISQNANSSNSNRCAELVSYTARTDSPGISISQDVISNNSTQPVWRSTYSGDHKNKNVKPICTQDLLSWAFQVTRGMEYLSQRKVLHGDLAARNILLAENNIVKISDFGLARTMYKDDNYKKQGGVPLPIKWMAIESIRDRIFSTQSDVWSFGIVLWEFFTLGETPYPAMRPERQYQRLIEGYRMEQPEFATDEVYNRMLQCWEANPTLRPTFTYLASSIGALLEECVKEYYLEMNIPYMDMNTIVLQNGETDYLTMMSAPDHDAQVSLNNEHVNSPSLSPAIPHDDSYIPTSPSQHDGDFSNISPRITWNYDKINFPTSDRMLKNGSNSESKAAELLPMLNREGDNYQETNKRTTSRTVGLCAL